jgi:hypothetical protein
MARGFRYAIAIRIRVSDRAGISERPFPTSYTIKNGALPWLPLTLRAITGGPAPKMAG